MLNRKALSPLLKKDGIRSLTASVRSILLGLLTGCIIILAVSIADKKIDLEAGLDAVKLILFGGFAKGRDASGNLVFGLGGTNIGNLLFRATPVIMTGLSVTFAF